MLASIEGPDRIGKQALLGLDEMESIFTASSGIKSDNIAVLNFMIAPGADTLWPDEMIVVKNEWTQAFCPKQPWAARNIYKRC